MTFDEFWEQYPVKKAKPVAARAWAKLNPVEHADVLAGVERGKASRQWREGFCPHPATFLNQRRWTDEQTPAEVPVVAAERPKQQPPKTERRRLTAKEQDGYLSVYQRPQEERGAAVRRLGLDREFERPVEAQGGLL